MKKYNDCFYLYYSVIMKKVIYAMKIEQNNSFLHRLDPVRIPAYSVSIEQC
jgi:hypothetical protein